MMKKMFDGLDRWDPMQSPGFLLWNLENLWQRKQRRALEPFGITTVQFLLLSGLAALENNKDTISQIELSGVCRTDPMMTSQVIRILIRQGLVSRSRDNIDKRSFALSLTGKGREIQNTAVDAVRDVEEKFFSILGAEIPTFADAIRVLAGERLRRRIQAVSRST